VSARRRRRADCANTGQLPRETAPSLSQRRLVCFNRGLASPGPPTGSHRSAAHGVARVADRPVLGAARPLIPLDARARRSTRNAVDAARGRIAGERLDRSAAPRQP